MNRFLTTILIAVAMLWALPAQAASPYEESLKQLAEGVVADAIQAKKERLAVLDFTDAKGAVTPIGKFLAEELSTQILLAGERKVVDRTLSSAALKKLNITQLDQAHAKEIERAAKMLHADVFITGSYSESPGDFRVVVKLLSPSTLQPLGAARGTIPKAGPLAELVREANKPPVVKIDPLAKLAPPPGLGFHRNDQYQLVVTALRKRASQITLDLTVENTSSRDIKVVCLLQNTLLEDAQGAQWKLEVENNREGLCLRGIELSPRKKDRAVLTFSAPSDADGSQLIFHYANGHPFILHYHEKSPRPDAQFSIEGLTVEPADAPSAAPDATPSPSN